MSTGILSGLAQEASQTIQQFVPTPAKLYDDAVKEVVVPAVDIVQDAFIQGFDYIGFGATLAFIILGGGLLLYGPDVFSAFRSVARRILESGAQFGISAKI